MRIDVNFVWHHLKTLPFFPLLSLLSLSYSLSVFHDLTLKHGASFSLQLSPEEGYASAKEEPFLCALHSCEERGLAGKALFRADWALVSGHDFPNVLFKSLVCLIFAFQNSLKSCCILYSLHFGKLNCFSSTPIVLIIQNGKKN